MCAAPFSPLTLLLPLAAGYLALALLGGALLMRRTRQSLSGTYAPSDLCVLLSESGGRPGAARWDRIDPADRPILAAQRRISRLGGLALVAAFAALWLVIAASC